MGLFDWFSGRKRNLKNKLEVIKRIFDDVISDLKDIIPLSNEKMFARKDYFEMKEIDIKNYLRTVSGMEAELIPEIEDLEKNLLSATGLKEYRELTDREKEAISFFAVLSSELKEVTDKLEEFHILRLAEPYDYVKTNDKHDEIIFKIQNFLEYINTLIQLFDQIEYVKKTKNIIRKKAA